MKTKTKPDCAFCAESICDECDSENPANKTSLQLHYEATEMPAKLEEAKQLIRDLLLVLHDRNGKKAVADRARKFLRINPGAKVGTWEDKHRALFGEHK